MGLYHDTSHIIYNSQGKPKRLDFYVSDNDDSVDVEHEIQMDMWEKVISCINILAASIERKSLICQKLYLMFFNLLI